MLRMTGSARPRAVALVAASLLFATAGTVSSTAVAHADTQSQLASEQQKATDLAAQIEANGNRVSVLDEQYTGAQLAIENATTQIASDQQALDAKQQQTEAVRNQLSARGAELYMGAGNPSPLASLDVTNASDLGSRSAYAGAAAEKDRQLLDSVKVAVEQLGRQQASLEKAKAAAVKQRDQLNAARNAITQATNNQQTLLSQVNGHIKTLVDQARAEKAAQEEAAARAAAEQLARQQAQAQQAQNSASAQSSSGSSNGGSSSGGSSGGGSTPVNLGSDPNLPAPSSQAQVAIDTAKAQLGKPYVYAGSGPDTFDCSGLTMYAWAAAGVGLPHNAEAQFNSLPHVAQSDLQPGDLVFYGSPIHHVGMFVGGGTMIEAPYTGVDVRYHTIYRPDYAGAARP
jgi:cell wall-associated NlpC family hydrolase